MSQQTARRRARYLQTVLPAALLGTLAGTLTAVPASASEIATGAIERVVLPPQKVARTAAATPPSHTVVAGDTVWAIARQHGLRTSDVMSWNGLASGAIIRPGQVLRLTPPATSAPAPASAPAQAAATHTVAAGDTITAIAKKHGTTIGAILAANGLSRSSIIYPGQKIRISGSTPSAPAATPVSAPTSAPATVTTSSHIVAAGDTITAIAKKHGTTIDRVLAANGLSRSSIIYPGQKLVIGSAPAAVAASAGTAQKSATLNDKQAENARLIIRIGRELGVSDRGIAIALATSMVESWMRNLEWGDRDSLGLFQQRPSTGWGAPEQIRNRGYAIRAFYGGPNDPSGSATRGLLDIPGWESMRFTDAAQAVQISAFPERYGQWEQAAYEWLTQHG